MFTSVCLSTGRVPGRGGGGVCSRGVPGPGGGSDPGGLPGPRRGLVETLSPRTATAAGGTHPTGMHSCLYQ